MKAWFDGKKSIIGALFGGLLFVLHALEIIDTQTFGVLLGLDIGGTGIAFRLAQMKGPK